MLFFSYLVSFVLITNSQCFWRHFKISLFYNTSSSLFHYSLFVLGDLPPRGLHPSPLFPADWPLGLGHDSSQGFPHLALGWILCFLFLDLFLRSFWERVCTTWSPQICMSELFLFYYTFTLDWWFDLSRILGWKPFSLSFEGIAPLSSRSQYWCQNLDAILILDHLWVTCIFLAESFRILFLSLYLDRSCFKNYYAGSLVCSFDLKTQILQFGDIFLYFSLLISFSPLFLCFVFGTPITWMLDILGQVCNFKIF